MQNSPIVAVSYLCNMDLRPALQLAYDPTLSNADWSARYITGARIVWLSVQVSPYCPHCSAVPGPSSSSRHWCGICLKASETVRVCAHRAARGIQSGWRLTYKAVSPQLRLSSQSENLIVCFAALYWAIISISTMGELY
jgi:hypothetical protein